MTDNDIPPADANFFDRGVLERWVRRVGINIDTHNDAEVYCSRRDNAVTMVTLGGVVFLGQLALVADIHTGWQKVGTAVLTVVIAVVSVYATIWDFRKRAVEHRFAARQYAALRRGLERLSEGEADSAEARWRHDEIHKLWDATAALAPNAPGRLREQAERRFDERHGVIGSPPM
jgi:hypothetical protein